MACTRAFRTTDNGRPLGLLSVVVLSESPRSGSPTDARARPRPQLSRSLRVRRAVCTIGLHVGSCCTTRGVGGAEVLLRPSGWRADRCVARRRRSVPAVAPGVGGGWRGSYCVAPEGVVSRGCWPRGHPLQVGTKARHDPHMRTSSLAAARTPRRLARIRVERYHFLPCAQPSSSV